MFVFFIRYLFPARRRAELSGARTNALQYGLSVLPVDTQSILSPRNTRSLAGINPGRSPPGANNKFGIRNAEFGIMERASRGISKKDHTKEKSQKFAFSLLITHLKYIREADTIIRIKNSELIFYFSVQNLTSLPSSIMLVVRTAHILPHIEQE